MANREHSELTGANLHPPGAHAHAGADIDSGTVAVARLPDASTTAKGIIEIATQGEVNTGTDAVRAVTPDTLANYTGLGGGGAVDSVDGETGAVDLTDNYAPLSHVGSGGGAHANAVAAGAAGFMTGSDKTKLDGIATNATAGYRTLVTLGSDVTNSTTTYADVTGLSYTSPAATQTRFYAQILFTSAALTTGSGWFVSFPGMNTSTDRCVFTITNPVTANSTSSTSVVFTNAASADGGSSGSPVSTTSAMQVSYAAGGNVVTIVGFAYSVSARVVQVQLKSEVSTSAIVAKAGSTLEWW